MITTWTIAIDWNRDGDYSDANEDVTSRVISANWSLGIEKTYQETAENSMLQLVLSNNDKLFSPENASSPLWDGSATPPRSKVQPFRPVRIQSNDGTTTRTHWIGWIETMQPDVGRFGKRLMKITATGVMQFYKAAESNLPLQEDKRTDEIVAALIREVVIPPALSRAWVLGRVGNSELGTSTYLSQCSKVCQQKSGSNKGLKPLVQHQHFRLMA